MIEHKPRRGRILNENGNDDGGEVRIQQQEGPAKKIKEMVNENEAELND